IIFSAASCDGLSALEGAAYDKARSELAAAQNKVRAEPTALTKKRDKIQADLDKVEGQLASASRKATDLAVQLEEAAEAGDAGKMDSLARELSATKELIPALQKRQSSLAESADDARIAADRELEGRLAQVQAQLIAAKDRERDAIAIQINRVMSDLL